MPFFAERYSREYALVYGASFANQTSPLEFGFWNKSNDFAHFRTKPELRDALAFGCRASCQTLCPEIGTSEPIRTPARGNEAIKSS
jgi:hypothetical protein